LTTYSKEKAKTKKEENVDQFLIDCVKELIMIYSQNPGGFLMDSPSAEPVKEIGRKLNEAGGKDLMLRAHAIFSANAPGPGLARNLEMVWDGVGSWRG
jgi:hypothetical protein